MQSRNNLARALLVAGRMIEVLRLYQQTLVDASECSAPTTRKR